MASNEEILQEFGCPEIPFNENVTMYYPAILSSMDAARKDEAVEILKFLTDKDSPYAVCYGSDTPFATIGDDYTIDQLYTIFKNQNS